MQKPLKIRRTLKKCTTRSRSSWKFSVKILRLSKRMRLLKKRTRRSTRIRVNLMILTTRSLCHNRPIRHLLKVLRLAARIKIWMTDALNTVLLGLCTWDLLEEPNHCLLQEVSSPEQEKTSGRLGKCTKLQVRDTHIKPYSGRWSYWFRWWCHHHSRCPCSLDGVSLYQSCWYRNAYLWERSWVF